MAANERSLDTHAAAQGEKIVAAAADRNKDAILSILLQYLETQPPGGLVLEIASGTGQHVAHFAPTLEKFSFQCSEAAEDCFSSISAWTADISNVKQPPLLIDAGSSSWPIEDNTACMVLSTNMCHISPWEDTVGLLHGASRCLRQDGLLIIYGPFKVDGKPTTESNAAFDITLRQRNSSWGLRDVEELDKVGEQVGLQRIAKHDMPANNFSLVFWKV